MNFMSKFDLDSILTGSKSKNRHKTSEAQGFHSDLLDKDSIIMAIRSLALDKRIPPNDIISSNLNISSNQVLGGGLNDISSIAEDELVYVPLQNLVISDDQVSLLQNHVLAGKGLIIQGLPAFDILSSIPDFLGKFFEWVGYTSSLSIDTIDHGFGLRITDSEHPVTHGYNTGEIFRLSSHSGSVITSSTRPYQVHDTSRSQQTPTEHTGAMTNPTADSSPRSVLGGPKVLVKQNVKLVNEAEPMIIPAVTVNEIGARGGRIAHFNFAVDSLNDEFLLNILNRTIMWAAKVDLKQF